MSGISGGAVNSPLIGATFKDPLSAFMGLIIAIIIIVLLISRKRNKNDDEWSEYERK